MFKSWVQHGAGVHKSSIDYVAALLLVYVYTMQAQALSPSAAAAAQRSLQPGLAAAASKAPRLPEDGADPMDAEWVHFHWYCM